MRFYIFLLFSSLAIAQNSNGLDSILLRIESLNDQEKIKSIISIPYDLAVSDIKLFEQLVDQSIVLSERQENPLLLAQSLEQKALALHFSSKTEEAIETTLKVIELYEKLNMPSEVGANYVDLGWKLKGINYERAFYYIKKV